MGQDLELDFEKYCVVDGSPKTVLLSPRHSKVEKRKARKKPKCRNEVLLSHINEFTEISLHCYRSASCRAGQSTRSGVDEARKRGSVYQSSKEVGKMDKISEKEFKGRKKIEFSRSDAPFPLEIFDSLCSSDEDDGSLGSLSSSFLEISRDSIKKQTLNKSLSSRLELPHSPTKSESDSSKTNSPRTRFSPFRKMFDPFVKSKSQKSPLGSVAKEPDHEATSSRPNTRNITSRKSLIQDFSNADCDSRFLEKDSCSSIMSSLSSSSPAHLNGVLKLGNKNRMPFFEFSVKNPNDVLVAKTWKVGNGCDWVYTFHTSQNRQKGFKDHMMVGQMRVSCYLCTELVNSGAFDNSMLTEFVLYDLARPKQSGSRILDCLISKEHSPDKTCESNDVLDQENVDFQPRFAADLPPDLETAAIVIQFPSEKRESLKYNGGDQKQGDLLTFSRTKLEKNEPASDCSSPGKVSVVISSGNHGVPSEESRGPSPLLDRWRLGGGCDCGGWDMGCPLVVFGNSNIQKEEACKQPVKFFLKGTKDNTPALTMKMAEDGQYLVDFHAQLTSLQAFSICVAILHSTEVSVVVARDKDRERLQCDSLRVFVEDEVKHLIDAVAEEDKRKPAKNEISPSFLVNPPFSPMSRA
ncbi:uncharacterized protein LOC112529849 [Cynara cardunculus var. scolymus]|uniref:Uncharacterized protein n=1 Tax=Cynara cardunculus var. scolymus TaxID=59895 RepID=A0A124SBV8_CYNCS|nr:uncharacterized protein LOC112529849 [Cynara cardunculus var. scolymus]KVH91872.1 Protein of unknown function DUF3527 [Cynara cardunculus var. scolymus]